MILTSRTITVFDAREVSEDLYQLLRDFHWGYDYPPDGGYAWLAPKASLEAYLAEEEYDEEPEHIRELKALLEKATSPLILIVPLGDADLLDGWTNG